jgi:hypothetical protein
MQDWEIPAEVYIWREQPNSPTTTVEGPILGWRSGRNQKALELEYLTMTGREFRKRLHEKRLETMRAEVLAEEETADQRKGRSEKFPQRRPKDSCQSRGNASSGRCRSTRRHRNQDIGRALRT